MSTAKTLYRDIGNLENELAAVCEKLVELGRCVKIANYWEQPWFKFEDGSSIVFGVLGPMYREQA